jgi:hypothetical protein
MSQGLVGEMVTASLVFHFVFQKHLGPEPKIG